MSHFQKLFDNRFIGAWDLQTDDGKPREAVVEISKVTIETLETERGKESCPVVWFAGKDKGMVLNRTNGKRIAKLYGADANGWAGKRVTLYPDTVKAFGEMVDCVRVKPSKPPAKAR
jgi:hypothetical protein